MWSTLKGLGQSVGRYLGFNLESQHEMTEEEFNTLLETVVNEDPIDYYLTEVQGRTKREYEGQITHLNDKVAVIDSEYYFHLTNVDLPYLRINDKVKCCLYSDSTDTLVKNVELVDEDDDVHIKVSSTAKNSGEEQRGEAYEGKVTRRYGRKVTVVLKNEKTEVELNLDNIRAEFIPIVGDLVSLTMSESEKNKVEKILPSVTITKFGVVTAWDGQQGVIAKCATFTSLNCEPGYQPNNGDKVLASLIGSEQDSGYRWRAVQVIPQAKESKQTKHGEEARKYLTLDKQGISISHLSKTISLKLGEKTVISILVTNLGNLERKYVTCTTQQEEISQMTIIRPKKTHFEIRPDQNVEFKFEVTGKFLGRSSETMLWIFRGFKIGRIFNIEVTDPSIEQTTETGAAAPIPRRDVTATQLLDRSSGVIMPGRRSFSPAAFVPVKLGQFSLSEKILKAALPDAKMNLDDLMIRVVKVLPCLKEDLQPRTYLARMHSLLYLEEVAMLKQVGELELQRATFKKGGDCLILQVPPLSAYTTKLVAGDMLIAREPWPKKDETKFEGVIHRVTQTQLHLQFAQDFHDNYREGTDYSVSFVTSRASLRRMHQAINLAVKHLGMEWLFPTRVLPRKPQVIIAREADERERGSRSREMDQLIDQLMARKREEDGDKACSPVDNMKYLMKHLNNKESERRALPKEMLVYSPDPRKLSTGWRQLSIEQKLGASAGAAEARGDINWNRHGSGYGMHCTVDNTSNVNIAVEQERTIKWFNIGLNQQQRDAVRNVLRGEARPLPYVIFGPPGTGKTVTVVETILQLHALIPESRLLVATPSNSAADLIAARLLESGGLKEGDLLRMVGYHYLEQGRITASIIPFSAVPDVKAINVAGTSGSSHEGVQMCGRELLGRHRITVGTLGCLGLLYNMGFPRGHFTHVIVDEAGQATEPELLIPMVFLHMEFGQVVLAGDPLQLGPVVTSRLASRCGLQDSLLSRLLNRFPYTRDPTGFPETSGYDPRLVTKLVNNYRSLPKILQLPSMLFYDNDLIPNVSEKDSEEARILALLGKSLPCSTEGVASPILFHGVRGENQQESESHSWFNPHEVFQVASYLNILYAAGLKPDQVGIITPYQLQSNKIRFMIDKMGVEPPKVGSVEEFQGQEKMAIIVSVVRSSPEVITVDMQKALGFVANGRRLNVALSRARGILIILGNPHLLCLDTHWRTVLRHCVLSNAYVGCDLPPEFSISKTEQNPKSESKEK